VWLAIGLLFVVVFTVLRLVIHDRFVVSNVSVAGAALTMVASDHTYFDEYLDEIIYFFEQECKDIVIFEDLDRYDDPQIFQALRELNTLLNTTPKRQHKIANGGPALQFIYAVRDSLFEKIGEVAARDADDDAARAKTVRANRTSGGTGDRCHQVGVRRVARGTVITKVVETADEERTSMLLRGWSQVVPSVGSSTVVMPCTRDQKSPADAAHQRSTDGQSVRFSR
jgi:hypothetical protein